MIGVRLIVSPCDQKWYWLPHLLAIIRWIWKKFSKLVKGFFKPIYMEVAVSCVCSSVTEPSERCCGRVYRAPSVFPSLEVKLSWQANFSTSFRGFLDSHQENKQRLSWWAIPLAFGCRLWWLIKIVFRWKSVNLCKCHLRPDKRISSGISSSQHTWACNTPSDISNTSALRETLVSQSLFLLLYVLKISPRKPLKTSWWAPVSASFLLCHQE